MLIAPIANRQAKTTLVKVPCGSTCRAAIAIRTAVMPAAATSIALTRHDTSCTAARTCSWRSVRRCSTISVRIRRRFSERAAHEVESCPIARSRRRRKYSLAKLTNIPTITTPIHQDSELTSFRNCRMAVLWHD